VAAYRGKVISWNTQTWEARDAIALQFPLAFSHRTADELFVACSSSDNLELWSATKWQKIADLTNTPAAGPLLDPSSVGNLESVGALAISSQDDIVYRAGAKGIRRWDLRQRNELASFALPRMDLLAASESGGLAAAEHSGNVHLINPENGQISHTFSSHTAWISALKFSRDGSRLVSASADRKLVLYDPAKRLALRSVFGHETEVWATDISADGKTIVSGAGYGGHILIWSVADVVGGSIHLAEAKRCALLDDGRILLHRPSAQDLEYYDPVKRTIEPAHTQALVQALTMSQTELLEVSSDSKWAVSEDGTVWNVLRGGREHSISQQSSKLAGVAFSPDNQFALTIGNDFEARLWHTDHWTSEPLSQGTPRDPGYILGFGFSGNSQRAAIAGTNAFIRVFDLSEHLREILLEREKVSYYLSFVSVAISKSGRWLAAGAGDNLIRIWDLETGKRAAVLHGHVEGVSSVSFSPDDRTLTSSTASQVKFWQVGSWEELMSMHLSEPIRRTQFSPDGGYFVAWERSVRNVTQQPQLWMGPRIWPAPALAEFDADPATAR
jgi:WD40 repeat protein